MLSGKITSVYVLITVCAVILLILFIGFVTKVMEKDGQAASLFVLLMIIATMPIGLGAKRVDDYKKLASEVQCYAKEQYGIEVTDMELGKVSNNEIPGTLFPSETAFTVFVDEEGKFTGMQLAE